MEEKEEKPVSD